MRISLTVDPQMNDVRLIADLVQRLANMAELGRTGESQILRKNIENRLARLISRPMIERQPAGRNSRSKIPDTAGAISGE